MSATGIVLVSTGLCVYSFFVNHAHFTVVKPRREAPCGRRGRNRYRARLPNRTNPSLRLTCGEQNRSGPYSITGVLNCYFSPNMNEIVVLAITDVENSGHCGVTADILKDAMMIFECKIQDRITQQDLSTLLSAQDSGLGSTRKANPVSVAHSSIFVFPASRFKS